MSVSIGDFKLDVRREFGGDGIRLSMETAIKLDLRDATYGEVMRAIREEIIKQLEDKIVDEDLRKEIHDMIEEALRQRLLLTKRS